jgi:EAL domain-containing protein (putative c-di-GMP-specific phosphodiesterase class I)
MDATASYETILQLAGGCLLLGGIWYWSIKRALNRRTRELREAFAKSVQREDGLLQPSEVDKQTGLYTPAYFIDQLEDYFHRAQTPILEQKEILIIKLVDLESIVQSFGYPRAESIINTFASQLKSLVNSMSTHLGRGVFALFRDRSQTPDLLGQLGLKLSGFNIPLVAGVAYWPEQGRSATKLMRHAETALAMSQLRQKRWLAYEPDMEPSHLDLDITALFVDGHVEGLFPVFQPQLNLHTGKIQSAEALVRWSHPRLGDIPPMAFIPLLEAAGLIKQITHLMIDAAVQMAAQLRARNLSCVISVNVTRYDFMETNLLEFIRAALVRHQGQASDLKLEFTEAGIAVDFPRVKKILMELSEYGVQLSLDNLGTGNSSLYSLSRLPLDELKIDRSFVGDMLTNPSHHSIVRAALFVARELNVTALAEGVEDDKTLQLLKVEGCDKTQGYVITKPLEEAEFLEFMQTHGVVGFDVT